MKYVIGASVIIIAAFIYTLSWIPIGIEPLTEVYFEDHTKLPKFIFPEKNYNFSYTINNLEHQKVKYFYEVKKTTEVLDKGEITLNHNNSITFFQEFSYEEGFGKDKITVDIRKDNSIETPEFKEKLWWEDPNYPTEIRIHFLIEEIEGITITTGA